MIAIDETVSPWPHVDTLDESQGHYKPEPGHILDDGTPDFDAMNDAQRETYAASPNPPWCGHQLDAWERGQPGYASHSARRFAEDVAYEKRRLRVREQARRDLDEEQAAEFASEWFGTTGDEFDPETAEPVPCVLEFAAGRYAFAPGVVFVFGPRSSGKSWLMYEAARQEVRKGNRALIIDYEMSFEEAMRRMVTLGASRDERSRVVYVKPVGSFSDAGRAQLLARFPDEPPSVVVLDSVGMSMGSAGLDSDKGRDTEQWAFGLPMWLKEQWPETVILLIDHVRKGESSATDPVGSQRKGSFADALYAVESGDRISRQQRGSGRLVLRKDRKGWGEEGSAVLDFEFGGGGPFDLSAPDPHTTFVNLSGQPDDEAEKLRIARYVGEHEGVKVEPARDALGMHSATFTTLKEVLVALTVIDHRKREGLFKGPRWDEFVSADIGHLPADRPE